MHDASAVIESDVPARLDRLPWTRFHTLVIVALGITWILDGLEVTIAGSIAGALQESPVLHFTPTEIGLVSSIYLAGAVSGALLFGYLTDRFGRRRLFMVTLGLYLMATAATALSWDFWSFALFAGGREHEKIGALLAAERQRPIRLDEGLDGGAAAEGHGQSLENLQLGGAVIDDDDQLGRHGRTPT